jgi:hypothetical protein
MKWFYGTGDMVLRRETNFCDISLRLRVKVQDGKKEEDSRSLRKS